MQQQEQQQGDDAQESQTVGKVPKNVKAGVAMDVGYGPNGTAAQSPLDDGSESFMKDRFVVQRTLTHKKSVVTVNKMCGCLRIKRGGARPGHSFNKS